MKSFFRSKKLRFLLVEITLIGAMVCTMGCHRGKKDDPKLAVFHGFVKDDVKTWDPANAYDTVSLSLVPSVLETLYQYSYLSEVYKVEPLLASGMPKYSADKLTLTIPIKHGIKFQDDPCFKETQGKGRELKAQDFVNGIKRLAIPSLQSTGWWVVDNRVVGINEFHNKLNQASKEDLLKVFDSEVAGLKALDDYTLQIKLKKPVPQMLYLLSMSFTAPVPKEAMLDYADKQGNLLDHPVGTGAFKLAKWDRNHEIVLEKNPNFRGEPYPAAGSMTYRKIGLLEDAGKPMPFVDRVTVSVVKESQPQWLNFMKGNADLILLPKDNFKQAITDQVNLSPELVKKGIHLNIETGVVVRYISFNMQDKLIGSNKYLRQALSSAINRDQWISIFTNGSGRKMVNAIPPGIPDRPRTTELKYDFDLAKAKELLKKAGYPDGSGLPPLKFDLRGASTTDRQLGDFVAQQFSQIGVHVEIIPNTFPAFLEKMKQGNLQISYGGWSMDYPDAENIYQLLYGPNKSPGPAESNYDVPEFNNLFEQIEIMDSSAKRAALVQKMDDLIQEDCPWAFAYYEASYDLSQPWFMNYRGSDIILNKYKYYRINKDIKNRYLE
jgi:ABC-type transport system substrate-binding protein